VRIVAVHGIGQPRSALPDAAAATLTKVLAEALQAGLAAAGLAGLPIDLRAAYYAHLLRRPGQQNGQPDDMLAADEQDIFDQWAVAYGIPVEAAQGLPFMPVRLVCDWLARSLGKADDDAFRRRLARFMCNFVRDAASYLNHQERREAVRTEVARAIAEHTPDVIVAHSLGSVVTYETLWAHPELSLPRLVTVGSPLALPGAIFDRLEPRPTPDARVGMGSRPSNVTTWINIADHGDIVAIPRPLHVRFRELRREDDHHTSIGPIAIHGFAHYLRNQQTVAAIANALPFHEDPHERGTRPSLIRSSALWGSRIADWARASGGGVHASGAAQMSRFWAVV
jgi:hypothetical protein